MRSNTKTVLCLVTILAPLVPLAGCATYVHAPQARRPEGMPSGNRGQSSAMVFNTPAVASAMAGTPEWTRPEYARNDRNLGYRPPVAITAIDEWPHPAPPSIDDARRFTLGRSAATIIFFDRPERGRRDYGRRRYNQGYTPHHGDHHHAPRAPRYRGR